MTDQLPYVYETDVVWVADTEGELRSVGLPSIRFEPPVEFGGPEGGVWTPEHLFVAASNACYLSTFVNIARLSALEFSSFECRATGKLEKVDGGYQITEIFLRPRLTITHGKDRPRALRILEKAERNCLITRSIKTAVHLEPFIDISEDGLSADREELISAGIP